MEAALPRRTVESDPIARFMALLGNLERDVRELQRGATLRNAAISGGDGLRVYGPDGELRISLNTSDGAIVAYDSDETPAARFGPLAESAPGRFGVEIRVGNDWVQLGYQTTTWSSLAGIPTGYDPGTGKWAPTAHTHPGNQITTAVANADGSTRAYNNEPGGVGPFYAVWVDANQKLCRNTSSIKYKTNVRAHSVDPEKVLQLRPVLYDRIPRPNPDTDEMEPGNTNEYGLIAEEVAELVPELAVYFNGQIDGVRYDLLALALLDVIKAQRQELTNQAERIHAVEEAIRSMGGTL